MTDIVEHWHVGYTEPNAEEKADRSLREANYATVLFWELVNKNRPVRGRPGQRVTGWERVPLYGRYIFIGARPGQCLTAANEARGISQILHIGETPLIVPHKIMDNLIMKGDANGVVKRRDLTKREPFDPDTKVEFPADSLLSGFVFLVKEDLGGKGKIWIESLTGKKMQVDAEMLKML